MVKARDAQSVGAATHDDDISMEEVLATVVAAIEDKKGEQPVVLDLENQLDYLDYIVICTGHTELHTKAIADSVQNALARYAIIPDGLSGYRHGDWILIDYGVLVVHIFMPGLRDFYRLEELWSGGHKVELK